MIKAYIALILTITLSASLVGCNAPVEEERIYSGNTEWGIIKIGDCQYVSRVNLFSHKGDCNNPKHIYNKTLTK